MKKKIIGTTIAAIALIGAWNFSQNNDTLVLSEVSLINIEALASNEGSYLCPNGCLDKRGDGCYCYRWYEDYEEKNW